MDFYPNSTMGDPLGRSVYIDIKRIGSVTGWVAENDAIDLIQKHVNYIDYKYEWSYTFSVIMSMYSVAHSKI